MDLCGHATLATAHCLKSILNYPNNKITFETLSGDLTVTKKNDLYHLNFPSRIPHLSELPELIKKSLNILPKEVYKSRDYLLMKDSRKHFRKTEVWMTRMFGKVLIRGNGSMQGAEIS